MFNIILSKLSRQTSKHLLLGENSFLKYGDYPPYVEDTFLSSTSYSSTCTQLTILTILLLYSAVPPSTPQSHPPSPPSPPHGHDGQQHHNLFVLPGRTLPDNIVHHHLLSQELIDLLFLLEGHYPHHLQQTHQQVLTELPHHHHCPFVLHQADQVLGIEGLTTTMIKDIRLELINLSDSL